DRAKTAFAKARFIYRHVKSIDMFLDGPGAKARDAVHLLCAKEKVRPDAILPNPDVDELKPTHSFRVVNLEPLVKMKLTSYRDKDRTHLRDLIDDGLLDANWPARLPSEA